MIEVSEKAAANSDYQAMVADVEAWEKANEKIHDNAMLFIPKGWGKFYPDAAKWTGTAEKRQEAVAKLHFPTVHPDLAV